MEEKREQFPVEVASDVFFEVVVVDARVVVGVLDLLCQFVEVVNDIEVFFGKLAFCQLVKLFQEVAKLLADSVKLDLVGL